MLVRVTELEDGAQRVEVAAHRGPIDGWMTPRELARTLPPAPDDALEPAMFPAEWIERCRVNEPQELTPGTDVVLDLEEEADMPGPIPVKLDDVPRPKPFSTPPSPRPCTTPDCKNTYVPVGRRSKCDACRYPADAPPKKPHPFAAPQPEVKKRATPPAKPSRSVAQRNTASPYDAVLADLRAKRDELRDTLEALDGAISGLERIAGVA